SGVGGRPIRPGRPGVPHPAVPSRDPAMRGSARLRVAMHWRYSSCPAKRSGSTGMRLQSPAVRMGSSIAVATGLYGVSFGALGVAAGLGVWQTLALSLLMFTGGSQFAFIGVVAGGGAGAAAFGAATLLGVRNAVYGMQMNQMLRPRG